jgi:RNA-directed DNA polymerase
MIETIAPLISVRKVAVVLGVPRKALLELALRGDALYRPYDAPKKGGSGTRRIDNPSERLKLVQARIYTRLLKHVPLPTFMFGGVPEKSIRDNAEPHVRQPWVVRVDLERFFPSVNTQHVANVWRRHFQTGRKTTELLTRLTTFSGHLPQGAPTSTSLANLILAPALNEFSSLPSSDGLRLSDWVDDISVSGRTAPETIEALAKTLARHGFRMARSKTRVMHAGQRQETPGVIVNRKPSVGPTRKRMLRDAMRSAKGPVPDPREKGLIAHTAQICKSQSRWLKVLFARRRRADSEGRVLEV